MNQSFTQHYLEDAISMFRTYKKLAEKALDQLDDEHYFVTLDEESNSIAVIMKHIAGNQFSRWTDFLTSDGEKPNRNRDMEFVLEGETSKESLRDYWERGWACLFAAIEPLQPADFEKKVLIRGEAHSIVQAINRQLTHYAYHVGQIVFLAKHFRSSAWQSLSIPRNRSAAFNAYLTMRTDPAVNVENRFDAVTTFVEEE
jgi:Protein of unknown function (DUF1572)